MFPGKSLTASGSWKCVRTFQRTESEVGQGQAVECERIFKQVLEARVVEMGIGELKNVNIGSDQAGHDQEHSGEQGEVCRLRKWWGWHVAYQEEPHDMLVWAPMDASG